MMSASPAPINATSSLSFSLSLSLCVCLTFNTAILSTNGFSAGALDGLGVRLWPGVGDRELRCVLRRCGMGNRTMVGG